MKHTQNLQVTSGGMEPTPSSRERNEARERPGTGRTPRPPWLPAPAWDGKNPTDQDGQPPGTRPTHTEHKPRYVIKTLHDVKKVGKETDETRTDTDFT